MLSLRELDSGNRKKILLRHHLSLTYLQQACKIRKFLERSAMEQPKEVRIEDGIVYVTSLYLQDPQAAAILAEYPETRWPEVIRRALKIGLNYMKGGAD
jgi:hypothetical protein